MLKVFYSWQSDLPNKTNRGLILAALEKAVAEIAAEGQVVEVDRDTAGVGGSPDIGRTIFEKIDQAAVFVCDVSILDSEAERPTPNPNVLVELGYAFKALGEGRVIMVMNTAFGEPELLPFDLKLKRTLTYTSRPEDENRAAARNDLSKKLGVGVRLIVGSAGADAARVKAARTTEKMEALSTWSLDCEKRLLALAEADPETLSTYQHGYWTFSYAPTVDRRLRQTELLKLVREAEGAETGWPPWVVLQTQPTYPSEGGVECWLKPRAVGDGYADYWRVSPEVMFFLLQTHKEDFTEKWEPGTVVHPPTPVWRAAQCFLHAARVSEALGTADQPICITAKWKGLAGRRLESWEPLLDSPTNRVSRDDVVETRHVVTAEEIRADLAGAVEALLGPLYPTFNFYEPGTTFYEREVNKLLEH